MNRRVSAQIGVVRVKSIRPYGISFRGVNMNQSLKFIGILFLGGSLFLAGCPDKKPTEADPQNSGDGQTEVEATLVQLAKFGGTYEKNAAGAVTAVRLGLTSPLAPPSAAEKASNPDLTVSETSETNQAVGALFDALNKLVDVEKLTFEGPGIADYGMTRLTDLKKVTTVHFQNANIGNATLETMSENMPNLVDLSLNRCLLMDGSSLDIIVDSENLGKIKNLNLQSNNFGSFDLIALSDMEELEQLDLRHCTKLDSSALRYIADIPNLKVLKLHGKAYDDKALANLAGHPTLQVLHLQDSNLTDDAMDTLASMPALVDLTLFRLQQITNDGLKKLEGSKLQRLYIRDNDNITDEGIKVLNTMPDLARLILYEVRSVTDEGLIAAIKGNRKLIQLALYDMRAVTDKTREAIATTVELRTLEMQMTGQTDATLILAAKLPKLGTLIIGDNADFTDKGLESLGTSKSLKRIEIRNMIGFSNEGIKNFQEKHPQITVTNRPTGGVD